MRTEKRLVGTVLAVSALIGVSAPGRATASGADRAGAVVEARRAVHDLEAPVLGAAAGEVGPETDGYWMLRDDGQVYGFGGSFDHGDAVGLLASGAKAVALRASPTGRGYWIADSTGQVRAFGDAVGRIAGTIAPPTLRSGERVTSMSVTPSGRGMWLFSSLGRVFTAGDAGNFGDLASVALNGPVIGSVATPDGYGYWMVASDGGVFAFGDATFAGSMGGQPLNGPVVGLVPDPDGAGYWLVASDGGVFAFDAGFRGSMGGQRLNKPIVGMVAAGDGYIMVGSDGGAFVYSDRGFHGSLGSDPPSRPIVGVEALAPRESQAVQTYFGADDGFTGSFPLVAGLTLFSGTFNGTVTLSTDGPSTGPWPIAFSPDGGDFNLPTDIRWVDARTDYHLNAAGTGTWRLLIRQPQNVRAALAPPSASGTGPLVLGPYVIDAAGADVTFSGAASGDAVRFFDLYSGPYGTAIVGASGTSHLAGACVCYVQVAPAASSGAWSVAFAPS